MKKYGVYDERLTDNDVDIILCNSENEAMKKAHSIWDHLTEKEKENRDLHIGLFAIDEDGIPEQDHDIVKQFRKED